MTGTCDSADSQEENHPGLPGVYHHGEDLIMKINKGHFCCSVVKAIKLLKQLIGCELLRLCAAPVSRPGGILVLRQWTVDTFPITPRPFTHQKLVSPALWKADMCFQVKGNSGLQTGMSQQKRRHLLIDVEAARTTSGAVYNHLAFTMWRDHDRM